jgi:hypothetical protein
MPRQPKEHCPVPEQGLPTSLPTGGRLPELVPEEVEPDEELLVDPAVPPHPPHPPQPVSLVLVVVVLVVVAPPEPWDVVVDPPESTHCAFSLQVKPAGQSRAESTQSCVQLPSLQ